VIERKARVLPAGCRRINDYFPSALLHLPLSRSLILSYSYRLQTCSDQLVAALSRCQSKEWQILSYSNYRVFVSELHRPIWAEWHAKDEIDHCRVKSATFSTSWLRRSPYRTSRSLQCVSYYRPLRQSSNDPTDSELDPVCHLAAYSMSSSLHTTTSSAASASRSSSSPSCAMAGS
jgi:hypothetical protein